LDKQTITNEVKALWHKGFCRTSTKKREVVPYCGFPQGFRDGSPTTPSLTPGFEFMTNDFKGGSYGR
jgi:hypothetical protein